MKLAVYSLALSISLACSSAALADTFPKSGAGVPYRDYIERSPCPIAETACVVAFDPVPEGKVLIVTDIFCIALNFTGSGALVYGCNGSRAGKPEKTVAVLPFPTFQPGIGMLAGTNLPFAAAERLKIVIGISENTPGVGCSITGNVFQAS